MCNEYRHSWVVIVGTSKDYKTLHEFVAARCLTLKVKESNGGSGSVSKNSSYTFEVVDTVEGKIETNVTLPK